MKRIVIVTTVPETIYHILKLQPKFLSRTFEVIIITSSSTLNSKISEVEGVRVVEVDMNRGVSPIKDLHSIYKMTKVLRDIKPDLIHSFTPKAGLVAMTSSWMLNIPVRIHTFTGLIFPTLYGFRKFLISNIDRLICLLATKIIPEGEGVKSDLLNYKITSKPLDVLGFGNIAGVDLEYYSPSVGIDGYLNSCEEHIFSFGFVGRLSKDKGISELVSAFEKLNSRSKLFLVGDIDSRDPIDTDTLNLIKSNPNIDWVGFQSDIRRYLNLIDVLVLPSYREGFPNVVLQAGAFGKPSIVTDVNGSREIISNGFNGWVVEPRSIDCLLSAMTSALSTSSFDMDTFGKNARDNIESKFCRKKYWSIVESFYLRELDFEKNF